MMIERVARKLCSLAGNPENTKFEGKPMWQSYVEDARAIVAVMRDPPDQLDNRSIYDHRIAVQRAAEAAGPRLYVALKALLEAVEERGDLAKIIESVVLADARAALAAALVQEA